MAKLVAKALGLKQVKGSGHYQGKNLLVTSARGHLVTVKATSFGVPTFPDFTQLEPSEWLHGRMKDSNAKILAQIKKLAKNADVLINACDAGREGELIFRHIQRYLKLTKKPFFRLWLQSLTDEAIRHGMKNLRRGEEFDNLAAAAESRMQWDWLIGINSSRALARGGWLEAKTSVGRVMTPTLTLAVDREKEILEHQPKKYESATLTFRTSKDEDSAATYTGNAISAKEEKAAAKFRKTILSWKPSKQGTIIQDLRTASEKLPEPLFNLVGLQSELWTRLRLPPKKAQEKAQELYMKGFTTYPRTDSKHLPEDHVSVVTKMLKEAASASGVTPSRTQLLKAAARGVAKVGKRVFDNSKVSDHYAFIPTLTGLKQAMSPNCKDKVLQITAERFLASFLPPAKYSEAKRKTQVEDYVFDTKESILLDPGYLAAEGKKADRKELPAPLPKGTIVYLHEKPKVESKATKPPARFTKASLLKAMETCYNLVSKDLREAMKGGIGTAATRADIIDKLCLQKWLDEQSNKTLVATPEAIQLVDRMRTQPLMRELSTVELTGQWELRLKQIEEGRANKKRYDAELKSAVERIVVCGLLGPPVLEQSPA